MPPLIFTAADRNLSASVTPADKKDALNRILARPLLGFRRQKIGIAQFFSNRRQPVNFQLLDFQRAGFSFPVCAGMKYPFRLVARINFYALDRPIGKKR